MKNKISSKGANMTDKTIIDTPAEMTFLKGKRITTVKKWIASHNENLCDWLNQNSNSGYFPLDYFIPEIN